MADRKKKMEKETEITAEELEKARKSGGGGTGRQMQGVKVKVDNAPAVFKRLMGYILSRYKIQVVFVVICIFVSVLANVQGTMFIQKLIDGYIAPMIQTGSTDYGPLLCFFPIVHDYQ